jgi:hypothetical protein
LELALVEARFSVMRVTSAVAAVSDNGVKLLLQDTQP